MGLTTVPPTVVLSPLPLPSLFGGLPSADVVTWLQYYPSLAALTDLGGLRCVNNGRGLVWWPDGVSWTLTTCWMGTPGGSTPVLRVASMSVGPTSPTKTTPLRITRGWRELSERSGAHHLGFDVYCPTLSVVEGFPPVVGWLEREPYFTTTYAVCEAFVDTLAV